MSVYKEIKTFKRPSPYSYGAIFFAQQLLLLILYYSYMIILLNKKGEKNVKFFYTIAAVFLLSGYSLENNI